MAKKKLFNPVVNELKGSAWFRRPEPEDIPQPPIPKAAAPKPFGNNGFDKTNNRSETTVGTETTVSAKKSDRKTRRASFEIYEDQLNMIFKARATIELERKRFVGKSAIMREALDDYFKKHGLID